MTDPLFSSVDSLQFGSFHYPLGLIEFTLSNPAKDAIKRIGSGEKVAFNQQDEETLLRIAYEVASLFHEMRHFVDMFGTVAGLSLFSSYIAQLKEFAEISTLLRNVDLPWKLPITEWGRSAECPQPIREFVKRARGYTVAADLFIAPFKPIEIDGHREDVIVELDYERGGKTDAFALRFGLVGEAGEVLRTVLFPVGLEALMEGNAHALTRSMVEEYFPSSIAERLVERKRTINASDARGRGDQRAAQTASPYMVSDLMITRFLRRHGISTFPRSLVFALVDRIFATASIRSVEVQPGLIGMRVDRVGRMLLDLLEKEDPNQLGIGTVSDAPFLDEVYRGLLTQLESGGDWDTVEDDHTPLSSVAIWEAYMAKHFIVPLLRERLATRHQAFIAESGFLPLINKIGLPPVRVSNDKLAFDTMPERVQQAWCHQLMLGKILSQLTRGEPILCPRAHATVPGVKTMNLAFKNDCTQYVPLGCGEFKPGRATIVPECLFEDALRVCALVR